MFGRYWLLRKQVFILVLYHTAFTVYMLLTDFYFNLGYFYSVVLELNQINVSVWLYSVCAYFFIFLCLWSMCINPTGLETSHWYPDKHCLQVKNVNVSDTFWNVLVFAGGRHNFYFEGFACCFFLKLHYPMVSCWWVFADMSVSANYFLLTKAITEMFALARDFTEPLPAMIYQPVGFSELFDFGLT